MPESPQPSIPPDDRLGRVTPPLEPTAIQSTRPGPRLPAAKEEVHRAERKQVAAPSQVVAARTGQGARWRTGAVAAALVVLAASLTGGALWWLHGRAALREEATTALREATRLRDAGQFKEGRELLENALARLGASGPGDLVDQVSMALADTRLVGRLDTARQRLFDDADAGSPPDFAETEREYATAFNEAVLLREGEEKEVIAARVRNSSVRAALLAAIEDWAAVTADEPRRAWLLAVACAADPDPDRDRLRRPELWRDGPALARLAGEPVPKSLSPELAVALGRRALSANVPGPVPVLVAVQKLHPQDYWLNFTTGWYLNRRQKWDEAIGYHRAALATRPRAAAVYYNLGMAFRGQRKLDEAIKQFEEALRLDPRFANAHNGMGLVLHAKRRPDEAMEHYKEAFRINPKHANAQVNFGVMLAGKKRLNEAIEHYQAALRINARHAGAHYHYGNALRARNELDPAIGQYQQVLAISPGFAAAHNALGNALCAKNQFDQAIPHYERATQIEPANAQFRANYAGAHNALGNAFHAKSQFDQAIPHYERAIQIDPANATFRANLGNSLRLMGRLDEAITRFREALRIDPKKAFAHNGLGNVASDKGDPDGAIPHYERAIRLAPRDARLYVNLGNTLISLGRHDAAINQYEEGLRIDPKNSMAHNGLGNGFLGKGQVDKAIRCFKRAIKLNGKNASAHSSLGIARLYGQGRRAQANDCFNCAAGIPPNNAVIQFNLGQALLASGRFTEAREAVRRSLELSPPGRPYRELVLQTMRHLEAADRLPALEARLPAIIGKKEQPAGAAEALQFAWLCQVRLRFAAAAGLYADSFGADPKPANELSAGHRLHAARCAALAAAGWGLDSPKPREAERARLRKLALAWLSADLTAWQQQLASADAESLAAARRTLTLWQRDFRFFAVRETEELAKLPEAERAAWQKLWADAEALRMEVRVTRPPERWAAPGLRVVEGLELWLDAARLNSARQARGQAPLKAGDAVETWFDGSGKGRHVGQAVPAARPRLVRVGKDWAVRFDGADDHLRRTGPPRSLEACTVFVVAAPHANPGGYRAFLAANEAGRRDYETGFNLDLGPGATVRFDCLSVEGRGFGGARNLLKPPRPLGTLHVLEVVVAPETKAVRLVVDGKYSDQRPFAPAPLGFDEITVGARCCPDGPGVQPVRSFLQGDIAEVLVYSRALSVEERKAVGQYLARKHSRPRERP